MDGLVKPAFDAASGFPIIQAALGVLIVLVGVYFMTRGQRDNAAKPPELIPSWIVMGPLHDMMQSVHEIAEEARRTNDLLKDGNDILGDLLAEVRTNRQTLELIRNESRLR
jgi:hypothetical protein